MTLRRRLHRVLGGGLLLFLAASGLVLAWSSSGFRRDVVEDRRLLARTIARSLDATVSTALQDLGRAADELPAPDVSAVSRLRVFRFHSPFRAATYVVDAEGRVVVSDPAGVEPAPADRIPGRVAVTSLVRKDGHAVLAIVQPFVREGRTWRLVSEMDPSSSTIDAFLGEVSPGSGMHVAVVDEAATVIASAARDEILRSPERPEWTRAIGTKRPRVDEDARCGFCPEGAKAPRVLSVVEPLRFAPWAVVVEEHRESAFGAHYTARRGLFFAGIMLAGTGLLLSRALSRSIVAPIDELSSRAERLRAGRLDEPISVTGDREIRMLAGTLDAARARLAETLGELSRLNAGLEAEVARRTREIEERCRELEVLERRTREQDDQRRVLLRRLLDATEEERRRLARELHDEIAQLVTAIQLSLRGVERETPEVARTRELLARTQQEIHRVVRDLRPAMLDDLGLATAMRAYARENLAAHGIDVGLEIEDDLPTTPEIEIVTFRIFQEIVTNVLRHAGAENVSIELWAKDGKLVLAVEDDGRGFDPAAKSDGAGVTGMRERAALVNGQIRFESEPGGGTLVVLEIPT